MKTKQRVEEEDIECLVSPQFYHKGNGTGKCPYGVDDNLMLLNKNFELLRDEQDNNFKNLSNSLGEVKEGMEKINDTILDPEKGLYSRVKQVETWKSVLMKAFWLILASGVGFLFTKVFLMK